VNLSGFIERGIDPEGLVFLLRGYLPFSSYADLIEKAPAVADFKQKDGRPFDVKQHWLPEDESGWILPRYSLSTGTPNLPQLRPNTPPSTRSRNVHGGSGKIHVAAGQVVEEHGPSGKVHTEPKRQAGSQRWTYCLCGQKLRKDGTHRDACWIPRTRIGRRKLESHLRAKHVLGEIVWRRDVLGRPISYWPLGTEENPGPGRRPLDVRKLPPVFNVAMPGGAGRRLLLRPDLPEGVRIPGLYAMPDGSHRTLSGLVGGVHEHVEEKKYLMPPGPGGRRLDVNPAAYGRLYTAERIFIALEGVFKTDALTQAGEVAIGVPSVTSWVAPELDDFLGRLRRSNPDVRLYVVPDSDWLDPDKDVGRHAFSVRTFLRSRGFSAEVAAPPPAENGAKVGVDDFLGPWLPEEGRQTHGVGELLVYPGAKTDLSVLPEPRRKDGRRYAAASSQMKGYRSERFVLEWLQVQLPWDLDTRLSEDGYAGSETVARHRLLMEGLASDAFWTLDEDEQQREIQTPARLIREARRRLADKGLIRIREEGEFKENVKRTVGRGRTVKVLGQDVTETARTVSLGPGEEQTAIVELTTPVLHAEPVTLVEWEEAPRSTTAETFRPCAYCGRPLPPDPHPLKKYHDAACRQGAYRARHNALSGLLDASGRPPRRG
jgi:hypothetical protein